MTTHLVQGYCPMGCGETLGMNEATGRIHCRELDCPMPLAVDTLLADAETEHVVTLTEKGWSCKHPMRERVNDELLDCPFARYMSDGFSHHAARTYPPGTYRVTVLSDMRADWARLS